MRAVVDTNVVVSGLLHPGRLPAQVLVDIAVGRLRPVVCHEVMEEYRSVLPRPRLRIAGEAITELLELLRLTADWVAIPAYPGLPPLPDPADWPFVACALVAGCPVVTGHARHFPAAAGVGVMTVREWVVRSSALGEGFQ